MRVFILSNENETLKQDKVYRFRSRGRTLFWPMRGGAYLGAVGAWNFLFRLGMQPRYCSLSDLPIPEKGDLLFVIAESNVLEKNVADSINRWLANGGVVIAGGLLPAWKWLLPSEVAVEQVRCEYPYAAVGWKFGDNPVELVAPPLWSYGQLKNKGNVFIYGNLVAIGGERQTPQRALTKVFRDAPAIIAHKNFIFLNGNPFAAFQAWLQGQEDISPWLQWRHRLFWLDEQAAFLLRVLNGYVPLPLKIIPRPIAGLPETVVVLRHDLDYSRDTSYLDEEREAGISGVHAILKDRNAGFWIQVLRHAPGQEACFHYNTGEYNRWFEWLRFKLGLAKRSPSPARHAIAGNGLLNQVRWAKKKGIGINTLHRHMSFLIYPEWVDALHNVFENEPEVLGASSLLRAQVLRWGCDKSDALNGTYGVFPDIQFPYWFPCKLAHAGLGGQPLRGWESSSIMEIEPELFEQMLDYRVNGLPQRIITINYHSAHARHPTFCHDGSLAWWKDILQIIHKRGIEVRTLREVYLKLDETLLNNIKGNL